MKPLASVNISIFKEAEGNSKILAAELRLGDALTGPSFDCFVSRSRF